MTSEPVDENEVDPLDYRRVVGRYATGITVITTCDDGVDHGMTVNSFTSVSLDPLLVLFCCEKVARFHRAVMSSGTWAVSVLAADQRHVAQWFATRGRPLDSQFDRVPHHRGRASGALVLGGAVAALECRTISWCDGGDHTVLLGEVLAVSTPRPDAPPLLYYEGAYREFGD